jgi:hypothetical protein
MMRNLWKDEAGFIISAELVLVATIVVIGLIVGLVSLRNQVVQELVDVGQAIGSLSQSFCFAGVKGECSSVYAWTDGTCYIDLVDFCQATQSVNGPPGGVSFVALPYSYQGGEYK